LFFLYKLLLSRVPAESKVDCSVLAKPFEQMISHPQGIRDYRQAGIHGRNRHEEARVDNIEIIQIVGLAIEIER
jgi:hypothetical protein